MARRATAIDGIRAQSDQNPVFVLDAGNALFGYWLSEASEGALTREAMDHMGYDAMTVGALDLKLGVAHLRAVAKEASFAILSANLVDRVTGLPAFDPYIILEQHGVRLGVIGLTEDVALESVPDGEDYQMLPYEEALAAHLGEVAEQSDVVVLLSHVGLLDDRLLAERFGAINAIIGGRNARRMVEPEIMGDAPIVQLGARGEEIGMLELAMDDSQRPLAHRWTVIRLVPEYADDEAMLALIQRYRETLRPPTSVPPPGTGP